MNTDELKTLLADHMIMLADSRKEVIRLMAVNEQLASQLKVTDKLEGDNTKNDISRTSARS